MGGSKSTTTNEQQLDPLIKDWITKQQGYVSGLVDTPFQAYTGPRVAGLNADQTAAADMIRNITSSGVGRADIARAAELSRLAGDYSPEQFQRNVQGFMSPYQQQVIDATMGTFAQRQAESDAATRSQMASAGAFGNERRGVYEAQLTGERELQERQQLANLYQQGYLSAAELASALPGQQMAAATQLAQMGQGQLGYETQLAGLLAGVGEQGQQLTQAELDAAYQDFLRQQQDPYQKLAALQGGLVGTPGGFMGTTTETTTANPGLLANITSVISALGGAAEGGAAAAAAISDRRLKRDIVKVGEYSDGLGKYEWTYIWGGKRFLGVMADEVADLRPWALGPKIEGFSTVNYTAL